MSNSPFALFLPPHGSASLSRTDRHLCGFYSWWGTLPDRLPLGGECAREGMVSASHRCGDEGSRGETPSPSLDPFTVGWGAVWWRSQGLEGACGEAQCRGPGGGGAGVASSAEPGCLPTRPEALCGHRLISDCCPDMPSLPSQVPS